MKDKFAFSLILILVLVLMPPTIVAAGGQKGDNAWVLVDIKDYDLSVIKSTEENFEFTYSFEYSRGSYSVRSVYDGESREVFEEKYVHGETYGALCEFGEPPQTIGIGETVTLDVSMIETENTLSGWTGLAHGYAKFVDAEQSFTGSSSSDISFRDNTDSEENWQQTLDTLNGISFVEKKITAIPPGGKRGDRIALRLVLNISSLAIGTDYIYELKEDIPVITGSEKETQPGEPADSETGGNKTDPWTHAGPVSTVLISVIAAIAAIFGGSLGGAADSDGEHTIADDKDPAYEKSKIPGYPDYVVGQDGEHLSKLPNGNIQITYSTGEIATHFPNGDLETMKTPDGSIWRWQSDGTIAEKKVNGNTIIRNQEMDVLSLVSPSGMVVTQHPEDLDAFIMTSPHGGSVVVKTTTDFMTVPNSEGRLERTQVERQTIEGTIRIENVTWKYNPDGSREGQHDDGSWYREDSHGYRKCVGANGDSYEEFSDGRLNFKGADGTAFTGNIKNGDGELQNTDGTYIKWNSQTGEVDAKLADGSFWKKDADGNGGFDDKENGTRGTYQSDGYCKTENDSASKTHHADGTLEFRTKNGVVVVQNPDGTENAQLPDGRSAQVAPDGSAVVNMPDGTVFQSTPDGQNLIKKPDGSIQNADQEQFKSELARYNDWYNKQLESKLNGK